MTGKARFCFSYATCDGSLYKLHAYTEGDGSLRDMNHANDVVRYFCRGMEDRTEMHAPSDGWRNVFVVSVDIENTRRGLSRYSGWDYSRKEGCPFEVAEEGMRLYARIKRVLRDAKRRKERSM